jgi:ABC-type uncharacterized transport system ATPase subunit
MKSRFETGPAEPILEIRGLVRRFGGIAALDGLDLSLAEGDLKCILGPNGCGKTTLFNVVTGALPPNSGEVRFKGERISGLPPHLIARRGITRKFQVPGIYPDLTVAENLEVGLVAPARGASRLSLLRRGPRSWRMDELLAFCGLEHKALAAAGGLAHGEKQWLEIGMLLAGDAELILLDEPTAGMSLVETERTAELVRQLCLTHGKTVLAIEHDMNFVRLLDCPVVAMMRGAVICEGTYETVRADPRVIESYLGKAA